MLQIELMASPEIATLLDQHRVNGNTDQDQEALKTQRKQAFQVVLPMWLCSWLPHVAMGMGARLTMQ